MLGGQDKVRHTEDREILNAEWGYAIVSSGTDE